MKRASSCDARLRLCRAGAGAAGAAASSGSSATGDGEARRGVALRTLLLNSFSRTCGGVAAVRRGSGAAAARQARACSKRRQSSSVGKSSASSALAICATCVSAAARVGACCAWRLAAHLRSLCRERLDVVGAQRSLCAGARAEQAACVRKRWLGLGYETEAAPAARRNRGGCGPAARQRRDGARTRRGRRGGWRLGILRGRCRLHGLLDKRGDAHDGRPNRRLRGAQRGRRQPRCERPRGDARRRRLWPARRHDQVSNATATGEQPAACCAPAGAARSSGSVCQQRRAAAQRARQPLRRAGHPDGGVAGAAQQAQRRQTRQARTRHRQACRVALRRRFDASEAPGRAAVCHRPSSARGGRRRPHGPLFGAPAARGSVQAPAGARSQLAPWCAISPPAAARRN